MGYHFAQNSPLAVLERQMRMTPNFSPRGHGRRIPGRYHLTAADVDCRYCLQYGRKSCKNKTCPYLTERLEAGAVTLDELAAETVQKWRDISLKYRALLLLCQASSFHFDGRLHIIRMMDVVDRSRDFADSKWLAAVYLLAAHTELWVQTSHAIWRNQIDFASVRLSGTGIQDYVLYRVAKGIFHGTLGATSEELADRSLVSNNSLLLILNAVFIARYGPQVMKIGRATP